MVIFKTALENLEKMMRKMRDAAASEVDDDEFDGRIVRIMNCKRDFYSCFAGNSRGCKTRIR